jgi:hypothetical protein
MPANDKLYYIGIEEWAKRKGMNYDTIIVKADNGRPNDLLGSRDSDDVVQSLSQRKEIRLAETDPRPMPTLSKKLSLRQSK